MKNEDYLLAGNHLQRPRVSSTVRYVEFNGRGTLRLTEQKPKNGSWNLVRRDLSNEL